MSDQDLFTENNNQPTPAGDPSQSQQNPFADKLSTIQNENGEPKYKDVDTALDALAASQRFIEQLKAEKQAEEQARQEAESKLNQMGSIEDFVNRIKPQSAAPNTPEATPKEAEGLSEEKIAQLLEQRLTERDQKATQEANLKTVVSKLSELYGDADKAREAIKSKAKELGTSTSELQEMAKKNPNMALQILGGSSVPSPKPSQSTNVPPLSAPNDNPRPTIEQGRGIAHGGYSNRDLVELFRKSKDYTNKRLGVDT